MAHPDEVLSVDFSRDGTQVASGSRDGTVKVWSIQGKEARQSFDLRAPVVQLAFSPEGRWLVASMEDGKAHVLSLQGQDQARPRPFQKQEDFRSVAFSPNGEWVVTAAADSSVKLWRWGAGSEIQHELNGTKSEVKQVAFNPTSTHVLAVSSGKVRVWQVAGQDKPVELRAVRKTDGADITSAALSADGTHMVVTALGKPPRVLQVSNGAVLWKTCTDRVTTRATHAEFSPRGEQVVLVSKDHLAQVRDLKDTSCDKGTTFAGHTSDIHRASFSPDGTSLLTASNDSTSRVWSLETPHARPLVLRGHRVGVLSAAFSPDSTHVVTGARDMTARVWSLGKENPFSVQYQHESMVWAATVSPDGQHLASASQDGTVRVWPGSGHGFLELKGHEGAVRGIAFSHDNQWLVTAGTDETLRLWSLGEMKGAAGNTLTARWKESTEVEHKTVAFSPAKGVTRVATGGSDGQVYFWRVEGSGAQARLQREDFRSPPEHADSIRSVAFNSDGSQLITASEDNLAKVWDASTGEEKKVLKGHTAWVRSATFSPNDNFALTASQDRTARVWDLRPATPQVILNVPHDYSVRWAAFDQDGTNFATAAADGLVRVWSMDVLGKPFILKPTLVLSGHEDEVTSVVYMGDKRLVTGSLDHTVRLWNNIEQESSSKLLEELDAATSVCLGPTEWKRYIGDEFPESTNNRYTACMAQPPAEQQPVPTVSAKGGE
jgi:WD40 repeat protein